MYYWVLQIIFVFVLFCSTVLVYVRCTIIRVCCDIFLFSCEIDHICTVRYPLYISFLSIQIFLIPIIIIFVGLERYWIRFDGDSPINIILIILYNLFGSALYIKVWGSINNMIINIFIFSWWDVRELYNLIRTCFFIWRKFVTMKWV